MTCRHNWSEETHEGVPSRFCHACNEWEIEVDHDRALAEIERLRDVGQQLCDEARAWLDGPATTNGDALLRDAIDLWEKVTE